MTGAVQYSLSSLLEQAGAHPAGGKRWNCPECDGRRTVSVDEGRGLYRCHHAGCSFSGNVAKLARELGLAKRQTPPEYRELRQNRERADQAARSLYEHVKARRRELNEVHQQYLDIIRLSHELGPTDCAWDALEMAYQVLPYVRMELIALEDADAAAALAILSGGPERDCLLFEAMCRDEGPASICGAPAEQYKSDG